MNGSEDCLHLNIWSPRIGQGEKLPVVVFVHGGAFQYGSNAVQEFAGDRFMGDEEMVFISPNYRLGVMGFLELGRACGEEWAGSGNCGMRDLLLSLKWVRENCGAFGGDPGRIILMGISAGAKVIGSLLTLPEVQEVCHRVILESGAMQSFRTVETAEAVAERFLAYLPEGTDVRTAPAETVLEAQAEFCACDGSTCFFGPVLEAPFREDWMTQWQRGDHFRGKAVIGCGRHELIRQAEKCGTEEALSRVAGELFGDQAELARRMAEERRERGLSLKEAWEPVLSDFMYRFYSNALAGRLEEDGNDVRCYSFDYGNACHGMGFAYLCGDTGYAKESLKEGSGEEARRVSERMREKILGWIRNDGASEDEWPRYRGGNKLILDAAPHMEYRPSDTLTGFPPYVYSIEK